MTDFRLFQTERVCGRQFTDLMKMAESTLKSRKHCGYKQFLLFRQCFQNTCTADT